MRTRFVFGALASLLALSAQAEVLNSAANGFSISKVIEAPKSPPPSVWAALADIGKWWDPQHTYTGDARNLTLEPAIGGCFCEKLALYAGVEHGRVVFAQPTRLLRLSAALGPLQELGAAGSMTWRIEALGAGSRITMTYNVGGYAQPPLAELAPDVDAVLSEQVDRLKRFLDSGDPAAPKP